MARIYDAQMNPSGLLNARQATEADTGGQVAAALADAGTAVLRVDAALEKKRERDAAFWVEKTTAQARAEWVQRMQQAQDSAELGAPDFTRQFTESFDQYRQELLQQAPTDTARKTLDADLERLKAAFTRQAIHFESRAAAEARLLGAQQTLAENTNTVRANPDLLADVNEQNRRMIEGLGLPGNETAKLIQGQRQAAYFSAISGRLDVAEDPEAANAILSELRDGETWKKELTERDYNAALLRAMRLSEQLAAKAQQEYIEGFSEAMREIEFGVDNGLFTVDEIEANVQDPKLRDKMIRRQAWARAIGAAMQRVRAATPEELAVMDTEFRGMLATPDPQGGPLNFDEEQRAYTLFQQAVATRQQALENDPAHYAMQVSEDVSRAFQAMMDDQQSPEAVQAYVTAQKAEQRRLLGADAPVNLLPNEMMASIAADLAAVERTPEGAQRAYERMVLMADTWGKHWPDVYRQLYENKVISGAEAVAARLTDMDDRVVGQTLMRAAYIGDKELKRQVDVEGLDTDVNRTVNAVLADFKATTDPQLGGDTAYRAHADAARTLALYYMSRGESSVDSAVRRAADELLLRDYTVVGSYRVPKDVPAPVVSAGVRNVQRNLQDYQFELPKSLSGLSDEDTRTAALSILRADGQWITNGDESGLMLLWPDGAPVEVRDEAGRFRPFTLTWDELKEQGAHRPPPTPGSFESRHGLGPQ